MVRRLDHGLSLAENIVAASLLALVVMSLLNLFPSALGVSHRVRQESLARRLSQNALEELSARPFAELTPGTQAVNLEGVPEEFVVTATVDDVDGYSVDFLKTVQVEVSWPDRGRTRSTRLEVYVHAVRR